ncbi:fimbrillin family protein [Bacteroides clarus]|uniref:Conserved domain protein n=2 Tax=Bacteroides clarus TaxID=626929 RepID=A0ABN0CTA9_9BACE|nr:fimbrillin family protein [Bacteroides clarus]EGF55156.1 conserved domain protein [Bacteroides clarus YIT 12056]RGT28519.1 hypothetical protein DWX38_16800 [Bacteroides clarus]SHH25142.1 hypothetical protein SAMN05444376_2845 [Bacteroides clarus YIT 12056]
MKKKFSNISLLLIILFVLASCSNEDYLGGHFTTDREGSMVNISAHITSELFQDKTFVAGDKIGITTSYNDNTSRNRSYTCAEDGATFDATIGVPIYIKGNGFISAYYPFMGEDGNEAIINLNTKDQSAIPPLFVANTNDITIGVTSAILNFKYAYAQMKLNLIVPEDETIKGYRLCGFVHEATVNSFTNDIELNVTSDLADVVYNSAKVITLTLIPQIVTADSYDPAKIVILGTNRSYTVAMGEVSLVQDHMNEYNIDLTDGIGSIEFIPGGAQWTPSTGGGNISSH